jgi:hypothetical protein
MPEDDAKESAVESSIKDSNNENSPEDLSFLLDEVDASKIFFGNTIDDSGLSALFDKLNEFKEISGKEYDLSNCIDMIQKDLESFNNLKNSTKDINKYIDINDLESMKLDLQKSYKDIADKKFDMLLKSLDQTNLIVKKKEN